jgi:transglutaminase-like putative cysteine protease
LDCHCNPSLLAFYSACRSQEKGHHHAGQRAYRLLQKPAKQVKQKKRIARLLEPQYDFRDLAKTITKGCKTDYQKIKAIYQWICNNIDYDTTYRIYTADSCIKARKGVCQ